jgi:hypothetical protein
MPRLIATGLSEDEFERAKIGGSAADESKNNKAPDGVLSNIEKTSNEDHKIGNIPPDDPASAAFSPEMVRNIIIYIAGIMCYKVRQLP